MLLLGGSLVGKRNYKRRTAGQRDEVSLLLLLFKLELEGRKEGKKVRRK